MLTKTKERAYDEHEKEDNQYTGNDISKIKYKIEANYYFS